MHTSVFSSTGFRAYDIASWYLEEEALPAARPTLERLINFYACAEELLELASLYGRRRITVPNLQL